MDRSREESAGEAAAESMRAASETATSAAQRMADTLEQGRAALADMQALLTERTREYARTADTYVRDNPWQAVGIAAGIGLVIGLWMGRR